MLPRPRWIIRDTRAAGRFSEADRFENATASRKRLVGTLICIHAVAGVEHVVPFDVKRLSRSRFLRHYLLQFCFDAVFPFACQRKRSPESRLFSRLLVSPRSGFPTKMTSQPLLRCVPPMQNTTFIFRNPKCCAPDGVSLSRRSSLVCHPSSARSASSPGIRRRSPSSDTFSWRRTPTDCRKLPRLRPRSSTSFNIKSRQTITDGFP